MPATVYAGDLGQEDVRGSIGVVCASVGPSLFPQAHSGHLGLEALQQVTRLFSEMVRSFTERLTVVSSRCGARDSFASGSRHEASGAQGGGTGMPPHVPATGRSPAEGGLFPRGQ